MGDFVFCYGSHNRKLFSKYIVSTKNSHKFYFGKKQYIDIEIETIFSQKYIVVDFNDSLDFLNFIVDNEIYCNFTNNKHECESLEFHHNYLNYITQHKHLDIVKIFYKKFVPLIKSGRGVQSLQFCILQDIDPEVVKCVFKNGSLEDTKDFIINEFHKNPDITIEFMDEIISIYKHKLTKLFMENKIDKSIDNMEISLFQFLIPALKKDDVGLFNFIIEEICNLTSEIDKTKLDKTQLGYLESIDIDFGIRDINTLIDYYMLCDFDDCSPEDEMYFCPNIFRQLIFSLDNLDSLAGRILFDIPEYNVVEYMGIICDFIGETNPLLINKMLPEAKSTEMAQLLIDCGADYEKLYESKKFSKCNSCVKKLIKELIKETSDS
ncbi:hypothetical protein [Acanthamoeba castellanii mimivirus]|uniref:Uncharacterized protein n=4 Tax=Mimivirus TaxID=315393 RepID=E3VYY4_MIMIV|nr:hypothetical protein MIMI_gp0196 [Acanthamoeba polyphaga mimivirus]ALR83687.1 hypothetical protein [Niemeyer virus]AMK61789.1 hypothetical protein [Samba virus]AMZ02624.1 hypothetical protein [Mimivirus Bombay]BAV61264.1 hypothetical protein [Acanthamoeba castellanii mimivirus]ADO18031.1 hypothetical protein [Acanthamoeba polyphaga mimivirus]